MEDYSEALQVDPQNSYAFYNRGITRDRSGDYQGAITDFSHAISLDPANADFFHNRGFSLRKLVGALCLVTHSPDFGQSLISLPEQDMFTRPRGVLQPAHHASSLPQLLQLISSGYGQNMAAGLDRC